jgi:hypothetical protein
MALHLIKLCVGCDSVADLEDWIKEKLKEKKRRGQKVEHIHTTRMAPKRADELTSGGSLYWVIGVRSPAVNAFSIFAHSRIRTAGRCRVVLDGKWSLLSHGRARHFRGGVISR